ncbi:MAG: ATP-binding protein [Anaerovoracaceae bacterium]
MKETNVLEFKEAITNTYLKTVSAFSNYNGGTIIFGITDNGIIVGVDNISEACLTIENKINDSIVPQPQYAIEVNEKNKTIELLISEGRQKPYLYKSKAYKRNDTASIEVDTIELKRLILTGKNINFEELPSGEQNLKFSILEERLKQCMGIEKLTVDVLRTLNLYSNDKGYNNAAAILSDVNNFAGIDIAKFGENISVISKRVAFEHNSIISAYEGAINIFKDYYQYEEIVGASRILKEKIPEESFREAIANALIHRTWDVNANIRVLMFDDRIEIISPGGLPYGITEKEYLEGKLSVLRNPIIGNVLYRLKIVEIFGTGILRIIESYKDSIIKPRFEINENSITIVLPIIEVDLDLSEDELIIYRQLSKVIAKSMSEIVSSVAFGKTKTNQIVKKLCSKGIVKVIGKSRGIKYHI